MKIALKIQKVQTYIKGPHLVPLNKIHFIQNFFKLCLCASVKYGGNALSAVRNSTTHSI